MRSDEEKTTAISFRFIGDCASVCVRALFCLVFSFSLSVSSFVVQFFVVLLLLFSAAASGGGDGEMVWLRLCDCAYCTVWWLFFSYTLHTTIFVLHV